MSRDGVIFGIAGTAFGLILGWIIGSQQAEVRPSVAQAQAPSTPPAVPAGPQPAPLDLQQIAALEQQAKAQGHQRQHRSGQVLLRDRSGR